MLLQIAPSQKTNNLCFLKNIETQKLIKNAYSADNSNQIVFKGSLIKSNDVPGKAKRFFMEALENIGGALRKLSKDNELPISKKPKIAKSQFGDWPARVIAAVKKYNAEHPNETPVPVPSRNASLSELDAAARRVGFTGHISIDADHVKHNITEHTKLDTNKGSDHLDFGDDITKFRIEEKSLTSTDDIITPIDNMITSTDDIPSHDIITSTDDIIASAHDIISSTDGITDHSGSIVEHIIDIKDDIIENVGKFFESLFD